MVNISDFVNRRYSIRNLSDSDFEQILPYLATEFAKLDFVSTHSDKQLLEDYAKLCKWNTADDHINSTSRLGMKLCEHFFPNFYDIETKNGNSFKKLWTKDNLIKILRWNRKSHSTPYLSEIKRGIYFCCGLPKSTMYRPQMMKMACIKYGAKHVLDPCAGWGGRMLGAVAAGCEYYAFEPNTETYNNLLRLAKFLGVEDRVHIFCDDARNMDVYKIPVVDLVLTSPPYFDLEVYTDEATQSINGCSTYSDWCDKFLDPVIASCLDRLSTNGASCWNVAKVRNHDMAKSVKEIHTKYGWSQAEQFSVISSRRQVHQSGSKNAKSSDTTVAFKKDIK